MGGAYVVWEELMVCGRSLCCVGGAYGVWRVGVWQFIIGPTNEANTPRKERTVKPGLQSEGIFTVTS